MAVASSMEFLEISPKELRFRFEPKRQVPASLTLSNTLNESVAFKVKTTAPKKYCVKPSAGVVPPMGSLRVDVLMQAARELPVDISDCKDKFLVQSTPCPPGWDPQSKSDNSLFDRKANEKLSEQKLRVVLEGPAAPPSPVPEAPDSGDTNSLPASAAQSQRTGQSQRSAGMGDRSGGNAGDVVAENRRLAEKVAVLEMQGGVSAGKVGPSRTASIGLIHLLMVALVAYALGTYMSMGKA